MLLLLSPPSVLAFFFAGCTGSFGDAAVAGTGSDLLGLADMAE